MEILYGFKSKIWPIDKSTKIILDNFADRNHLSLSLVNATIWLDECQKWNDSSEAKNCIQVTYYTDPVSFNMLSSKYVYPMICKRTDAFEPNPLYAESLHEYLTWCAKCTSTFNEMPYDVKMLRHITNAENALIELEMVSTIV